MEKEMNKVVSFFLTLLLAQMAQAQSNCTTLLYTGAPLTSLAVVANYPYYPMGNPIVGKIVLNEPLPLNATDLSVAVSSWSYNILGFTPGLGLEYRNAIKFTTVNGVITDWDISLYAQVGFLTEDSPYYSDFVSSSAGDSVSVSLITLQVLDTPPVFLGSNTTRGSWACDPVDALAAQLAAANAKIASQAAIIAVISKERDEYVNSYRVADQDLEEYINLYRAAEQEIATLEKKK
jgi:hypothetical protein